ncbi:MAG TPA: TetR family transcriptional regulator [Pilimelia sp.]|nr:TetR family transcriptional regulator [Pilimelia sp.]
MDETPAPTTAAAEPATARGEQTRALILDTAMRLFRTHGYARTTMRAIAREAGVAVGNAYYYFPSKEHLVQHFYLSLQDTLRTAAAPALAGETSFTGRLAAVLRAGIAVNAPYHSFAATFFKTAAEPDSPLSPLSAESAAAREAATALFREVVEGATDRIDPELRAELPDLLWLAYLGVVLFWVHDRSPGQHRTATLIDGLVPLVGRLVRWSRLRALRPVTREVLALVRALRE